MKASHTPRFLTKTGRLHSLSYSLITCPDTVCLKDIFCELWLVTQSCLLPELNSKYLNVMHIYVKLPNWLNHTEMFCKCIRFVVEHIIVITNGTADGEVEVEVEYSLSVPFILGYDPSNLRWSCRNKICLWCAVVRCTLLHPVHCICMISHPEKPTLSSFLLFLFSQFENETIEPPRSAASFPLVTYQILPSWGDTGVNGILIKLSHDKTHCVLTKTWGDASRINGQKLYKC